MGESNNKRKAKSTAVKADELQEQFKNCYSILERCNVQLDTKHNKDKNRMRFYINDPTGQRPLYFCDEIGFIAKTMNFTKVKDKDISFLNFPLIMDDKKMKQSVLKFMSHFCDQIGFHNKKKNVDYFGFADGKELYKASEWMQPGNIMKLGVYAKTDEGNYVNSSLFDWISDDNDGGCYFIRAKQTIKGNDECAFLSNKTGKRCGEIVHNNKVVHTSKSGLIPTENAVDYIKSYNQKAKGLWTGIIYPVSIELVKVKLVTGSYAILPEIQWNVCGQCVIGSKEYEDNDTIDTDVVKHLLMRKIGKPSRKKAKVEVVPETDDEEFEKDAAGQSEDE